VAWAAVRKRAAESGRRYFWAWLAALVVAGVLLTYWRVPGLGWALHDDRALVKNAETNVWYLPGKAAGVTPIRSSPQGIYRPTQFLAFELGGALWGSRPLGFHLLSLALHAANILLFAWLMWRLTGSRATALVAAVLALAWVIPEAIVWIGANCDLLCLFFCLWSAVFLIFTCEGRLALLAPAALCFLLALGSKETAFVFPAVVTLGVAFSSGLTRPRKALVAGVFWLCLGAFCVLRWQLGAVFTGHPSWFWLYATRTARHYAFYLAPQLYTFAFLWTRLPLTALKYYVLGPAAVVASVGLFCGGVFAPGVEWRALLRRVVMLGGALVLGGVTYLYLLEFGRAARLPVEFGVAVAFLAMALTGRWKRLGWFAVAWAALFAMPAAPQLIYASPASRYFYIPDLGKLALVTLVCRRYEGWWERVAPVLCAAYMLAHTFGNLVSAIARHYPK